MDNTKVPEFKVGSSIVKINKGTHDYSRIYTIKSLDTRIEGNWHDGYGTRIYATLDDNSEYCLAETSHTGNGKIYIEAAIVNVAWDTNNIHK